MNNHPGSFHGEIIFFCDKKNLQIGKYYAMTRNTRISYHYISDTLTERCYSHHPQEYVGWYKGSSVDGFQAVFEENEMERVIDSRSYTNSVCFIEAQPPMNYSYVLK